MNDCLLNCSFFNLLKRLIKRKYNIVSNNEYDMKDMSNITLEQKIEIIFDKINNIFDNNKFKNEINDTIINFITQKYFIEIDCDTNINQKVVKLICNHCKTTCYLYKYKCSTCYENHTYDKDFLFQTNYTFDQQCNHVRCCWKQASTEIFHQFRYHDDFVKHVKSCTLKKDENIILLFDNFK